MKKIFYTVVLLLGTGFIHAQQLFPATISNGGNSKTAGGVLLNDNLGGFAITTIASPSIMYTQDFLQPDAGSVTGPLYINNVTLGGGAVLDNAGTTFTRGGVMLLEFTTGEFASITLTGGSHKLTQGILQPQFTGGSLPVTGLEFYAKRLNSTSVQLTWKTRQEINNKGFHIERKKEQEPAFVDIGFIKSQAGMGGNSSLPLDYQQLDQNNFTGTTYYRLKQEDIDGRTSYSVVRLVKGDVNKQLSMQVWPVPAIGFFNVTVNGLTKTDMVQVFSMDGRLVKELAVQNQTQQQVNGLPAGTYFIKLAGDKTVGQKVVLQ